MDIRVARRNDDDPMKVYRSSMEAVVIDLGHHTQVTLHRGEATALRDGLIDVLRPRAD